MIFDIIRKSFVAEGSEFYFCTRPSLLKSVAVTEFQATEAYSNLDLTKAKNSISRLSKVEKENVSVRINPNSFIAREENNRHADGNEVYNRYIHLIIIIIIIIKFNSYLFVCQLNSPIIIIIIMVYLHM
jgi:hypothetical protein